MQDLFVFKQAGFINGMLQGSLVATGLRPRFLHKMAASNIELPASVFEKN
jgi:pilus assembly protein CpaF